MNANEVINPVVIINVDEDIQVDVAVRVQIDIVGSIIQEAIDRIQIAQIIAENPAPVNDPSIV